LTNKKNKLKINKLITMKKIYFSLASIMMCGGIIAQNAPKVQAHKAQLSPNSKVISKSANTRAAGPFAQWIEPLEAVMTNKGLTISGNGTLDQDLFITPIFQDSTVKYSSTTNSFIYNIMLGSVLDLKSDYMTSTFEPIASQADAYTVDSLFIYGSYVKVTPSVDTLYAWLVWGDSTTTSVFTKRAADQTWVDPLGTWRTSVIGPKMTGATAAAGNKAKPAAPANNMKLIKYVLTDSDSVSGGGFIRGITVPLDAPVNIPAGNLVSCIYTFVPGGAYVSGDVTYKFSNGSLTQNINGFAGAIWGQVTPEVTGLADYVDQQVDPDGWNMGANYSAPQRHNEYWQTFAPGDLVTSPYIGYYVTGNSTVAVAELASKGVALTQNMPNPANGSTTIGYELTKTDNVVIEVRDITGKQVMVINNGKQVAGKYSVEMDLNKLDAGVYFYSLITDNAQITKKMNVIK
jgi:hypothetical protein